MGLPGKTFTLLYSSADGYVVKLYVNGVEVSPRISSIKISSEPPLSLAVVKLPIEEELSISAKTPMPGIVKITISDRKRAIATRYGDEIILCFTYTPLSLGAYHLATRYIGEKIKILKAYRREDNKNILVNNNVYDEIDLSRERLHKITHQLNIYVRKYLARNWLILDIGRICPELPRDIIQY